MDSSPNSGESSSSPELYISRDSRGSSLASPGPRLPPYGMISQNSHHHQHSFAYDNPIQIGCYNGQSVNINLNHAVPAIKFEREPTMTAFRSQSNRVGVDSSCAMRENSENHVKEFIENNMSSNTNGVGNKFNLKQVICICEVLMKSKNIGPLEQFLLSLPRDLQGGSETAVRAKISVLFHREAFSEMYKIMQSYDFSPEYHEELQKLWYLAHYKEQEKVRGRPLGAVDKYRLRKKHPLPKSFWDGEETVYCFKERSRAALKDFYQKNRYPTQDEKKSLAKQIKLTVMQVSNWFKNKRQRDRTPQSREPCEISQMGLGHSPGSSGHGHHDIGHARVDMKSSSVLYGHGGSLLKYPSDEIGAGSAMAHLRQPISLVSMKGEHGQVAVIHGHGHGHGQGVHLDSGEGGGAGNGSGGPLTQHQINSLTTGLRAATGGPGPGPGALGQHQINLIENHGNGNFGGNIRVIQELQAGGHFYQHPTSYESMTSIQHSNPHSIAALSY